MKKKSLPEEAFDVVIIGSGLGGLICALVLAREGKKVCVLEKNRQYGGNLQIFSRDKVIFDTGVHYIGGLDRGQNLDMIFRYLGIRDDLNLIRMDNDFEHISFEGNNNVYKYTQGYDGLYENLCQKFPKEKEGIKKYIQRIREVSREFPMFNLRVPDSSMGFNISSSLTTNARAYIESLTQDPLLRNVLAATNALYAGQADKTPLYVHALINHSYFESSWKCVDGGAQIEKLLTRQIKKHGGTMVNYAEVVKFHSEDKKITCVELASGEMVYGKNFISNIHPAITIDLLDKPSLLTPAYRKRVKNLENSISTFVLNATLKPESYPYMNHNIYHFYKDDVWDTLSYRKKEWPLSFAAYCPASSRSPDYAEGMILMSYMNYKDVKKWKDTVNLVPNKESERDQAYQDFKAEYTEKFLDKIENRMPGINAAIKNTYTCTPLSYRDYMGTTDGSIYGIVKDYKDPLSTFVSHKTRIKNLLLTGQNVNMHGILGVTITALLTLSEFIGTEYLIKGIHKANE